MKRSSVSCLSILLATFPLAASAAALWQGTIGEAAVVVKLDSADPASSGTYFYRRYLLDIPLQAADGAVREGWDDQAGAQWKMQPASGDTWQGTWIGADGRQLPVRLRALPVRAADWRTAIDQAYDNERVRLLTLTPGRIEKRGKVTLRWYEEPRSKMRSVQVESGYAESARKRINEALREQQWDAVNSYFGCMSAPRGGTYQQATTLRYVGTDALSISFFTDYDCGGAHPDFGDMPMTFDAKTGETLALEDVLYLGKGQPPREDGKGDAALDKYRQETLAPWLLQAMSRVHPKEMKKPAEEGACDYADVSVWQFVSWHVRPAGLYIGPGFARVARACEYPAWSVLPWRTVAEHAGRVRVGPAVK